MYVYRYVSMCMYMYMYINVLIWIWKRILLHMISLYCTCEHVDANTHATFYVYVFVCGDLLIYDHLLDIIRNMFYCTLSSSGVLAWGWVDGMSWHPETLEEALRFFDPPSIAQFFLQSLGQMMTAAMMMVTMLMMMILP